MVVHGGDASKVTIVAQAWKKKWVERERESLETIRCRFFLFFQTRSQEGLLVFGSRKKIS